MKKLLSLPPNLVGCFHDVTGLDRKEWFCSNDPVGKKLGSGGGTTWLLQRAFEADVKDGDGVARQNDADGRFDAWLASEKRLVLHAGGQSRRLPAYAPSGKILTPVPVFRWERGQRLSQDLLSLQIPLYKRIMDAAPERLHTMIVSGDVYIRSTKPLGAVPDADVVCYGLWLGAEIAKDHGVFVSRRETPGVMECMLQKPSVKKLGELLNTHLYLTDIGIWLLSDRAVKLLMKKSVNDDGTMKNYDLYSEFGCSLGTNPVIDDSELAQLTVAVLPLPGGEFYHFGTSHEIISSTLAIQNLVNDQREIMHHSQKPHPSMFVQNAEIKVLLTDCNRNIWIENSCVGQKWTLSSDNIVTGIPRNDWTVSLQPGQCADIVPVGEDEYAIRPYGYGDKFRGPLADSTVTFLGIPFCSWAIERDIDIEEVEGKEDLQSARIFPVCSDIDDAGLLLRWMLGGQQGLTDDEKTTARMLYSEARKLSADDISAEADLVRLTRQRAEYRAENWSAVAKNWRHSVFYQVDLCDAAREFSLYDIPQPAPISDEAPLLTRIHDSMFRSELARLKSDDTVAKAAEEHAFALLRQGLIAPQAAVKQQPRMSVYSDQIVWARSPVRIDIAGDGQTLRRIASWRAARWLTLPWNSTVSRRCRPTCAPAVRPMSFYAASTSELRKR